MKLAAIAFMLALPTTVLAQGPKGKAKPKARTPAKSSAGACIPGTVQQGRLPTLSMITSGQTIERGTVIRLEAEASSDVAGPKSAWKSADAKIACVDPKSGAIRAKDEGLTTINVENAGKTAAVEVNVVILYRSLAPGKASACDIASGGVAECWGENYSGQLGDRTKIGKTAPVVAASSVGLRAVAMGEFHACALASTGAAYCWGGNADGQLGTGVSRNAEVPTAAKSTVRFKSITAGRFHSCAITDAGKAYCWGDNSYAQLGTTSTNDAPVPTPVATNLTFASIEAGSYITCGVTTGGQGHCWGSDQTGQLGDGGPINGQTTDMSRTPVEVAGGMSWKTISAGSSFTCGVTTAGAGYCWGRAGYLGKEGDDDSSSPSPVSGGLSFADISAGYAHSCGLTTSNEAWCWGTNLSGELGAETEHSVQRVPVRAGGGLTFSEIAASPYGSFTCGVSMDRLTTYCWGRNDSGELGNGTTTGANDRNFTPTVVKGQEPLK